MPKEDDRWSALIEEQNRNLLALVEAMKTPTPNDRVSLPDFDPDVANSDARAWISTADICMTDRPLQSGPLMIALARALKGHASAWLSQVSFPGIKWEEFKEIFKARYDCPETPAAFLINLQNGKPTDGECLAAYAASLMTLLTSRWKNLSNEEIAVSTVLAQISQIEPRVQRLAYMTEIETRNELQEELRSISFLKRKAPTSSNDRERFENKQPRTTSTTPIMKCYNCGKLGHKSLTCHTKNTYLKEDHTQNTMRSESSNKSANTASTVTCFKYQAIGH